MGANKFFSFMRSKIRYNLIYQYVHKNNFTYVIACQAHFEPSQFEQNRLDGWRKLKPNAVPTIFNTPNPPKTIDETGISNVSLLSSLFSALHVFIVYLWEYVLQIEILLDEDSANLDSQILNLSELGKTDEVSRREFDCSALIHYAFCSHSLFDLGKSSSRKCTFTRRNREITRCFECKLILLLSISFI